MVISCILHGKVCVFVMVVFMCDACVFSVMGFSAELWYRRIYRLISKHIRAVVFVATNITI